MANGPLSEKLPPLAQTSGYATDCGGRHFSIRPGVTLPHVGSLTVPEVRDHLYRCCYI